MFRLYDETIKKKKIHLDSLFYQLFESYINDEFIQGDELNYTRFDGKKSKKIKFVVTGTYI